MSGTVSHGSGRRRWPRCSRSAVASASWTSTASFSPPTRFRVSLKKFRDSSSTKAVVVRINSPGGGVAASQEIHRELSRFRSETKKPVVVSMESVAASGGYYAAAPADKIFANPRNDHRVDRRDHPVDELHRPDGMGEAPLRHLQGRRPEGRRKPHPHADGRGETSTSRPSSSRLRSQFQKAGWEEGRKGRLKPGTLERMSDGRVVSGEEAKEARPRGTRSATTATPWTQPRSSPACRFQLTSGILGLRKPGLVGAR